MKLKQCIENSIRKCFPRMYDVLYRLRNPGRRWAFCPFCQRETPRIPGGRPHPRAHAQCAYCHALERHRFLYSVYRNVILNQDTPRRLLHLAPEDAFREMLCKAPGISYLCGDLHPDRYPEISDCREIDALHTGFPDASFDLVLANHLIEHVDEPQFLREINRILKPGGRALISTPVYRDLPHTFEDPSCNTPELRREHYGHAEHLRKYGRDAAERFAQGFKVSEILPEAFPDTGDTDAVNCNCFVLEKQ